MSAMKKFVIKIGLFVAILALILVGFYNINQNLIKRTSFKLHPEVITLATGNSTMQYGLNTKYVDACENIAVESEPLFMSYFKLKEILKENSHIQNVIVPFSFIDVRKRNDYFLSYFDEDGLEKELYSRFCCLTEFIPYSCLKDFDVDGILYAEAVLRYRVFLNFTYLVKYFRTDNFNSAYLEHIGQFKKMEIDSQIYSKSYSKKYLDHSIDIKFAGETLERKYSSYLDSIVSLCSALDKSVYIINMPNYPEFVERIPSMVTDYYYQKVNRLKQFNQVYFLDYSKLIENHDCFCDENHLNWRGAEAFSKQLASDLLKK